MKLLLISTLCFYFFSCGSKNESHDNLNNIKPVLENKDRKNENVTTVFSQQEILEIKAKLKDILSEEKLFKYSQIEKTVLQAACLEVVTEEIHPLVWDQLTEQQLQDIKKTFF